MRINVEGQELSVIDGAVKTIRRNRPVLIIEASSQTISQLNERLSPMGYTQHVLADLIGVPGGEGDYVFMP